jgi:hypothetical protein
MHEAARGSFNISCRVKYQPSVLNNYPSFTSRQMYEQSVMASVVLVHCCRVALISFPFIQTLLSVFSNIKEPFNCVLTKWNAVCKHFVKYEYKHWSQNLVSCQYLLLDSPHCCWTYLSGPLRGNKTRCSLQQLHGNTLEHLQLTVRAACIQFSETKTNMLLHFSTIFVEFSLMDTLILGYLTTLVHLRIWCRITWEDYNRSFVGRISKEVVVVYFKAVF